MKTTIKHYRKWTFMYGITTTLMVLEHYEKSENYEECQKIIDSIKEQEEKLGIKLWTRNSDESFKEVIKSYEDCGLTGKNAYENSEYYRDVILKEIQES